VAKQTAALSPSLLGKLLKGLPVARSFSYSPYSKFKVGCALLANGKVYSGTNIENVSYGATVCAERVAIWKAISEGKASIDHIVVVIDKKNGGMPCACQVDHP
jgi:cytidine deaminase